MVSRVKQLAWCTEHNRQIPKANSFCVELHENVEDVLIKNKNMEGLLIL